MNDNMFIIISSLKNNGSSWNEIYKELTYSSMNSMKQAFNRKRFLDTLKNNKVITN